MILRPWKRIRELEADFEERLARLVEAHARVNEHLDATQRELHNTVQRLVDERERHATTRASLAAAEARAGAAEEHAAREAERAEKLLTELLALKRDGFHPPEPPPPAPPPLDDLPSEVREALGEVARPGSETWYSELALAQADLAAGKPASEVAKAILRGGSYKPW